MERGTSSSKNSQFSISNLFKIHHCEKFPKNHWLFWEKILEGGANVPIGRTKSALAGRIIGQIEKKFHRALARTDAEAHEKEFWKSLGKWPSKLQNRAKKGVILGEKQKGVQFCQNEIYQNFNFDPW